MESFDQYFELIRSSTKEDIERDTSLSGKLTIHNEGRIRIDWSPFDHINRSAQIVLVGLTPGLQQARNALLEAHRALASGSSAKEAAIAAKTTASFSGPMRPNLIAMLDHIGVQRLLGLASAAELFGDRSDIVHYTSALRHPVYIDGKNWSGNPDMLSHPLLRKQLESKLAEEVEALPDAIYVPLGGKVADALHWLVGRSSLKAGQILDGMPHPSGANAERIAYFLGRKPASALSSKTNPATIDEGLSRLRNAVRQLQANHL